MLRALLFASLCLLPALPARDDDPVGRLCGYAFDDRVAAAKQSYSSNDGRFTLAVEESRGMRMNARSASVLILEGRTARRSQRVYRARFDFAVTSAAIDRDGRVTLTAVGVSQQYGFEGEQTLLAFLDEAGEIVALHTRARGSNGGWNRSTTADFFAVDALPNSVFVRASMASEGGRFLEWQVYDRMGTLRGTVDTRQLMHAYSTKCLASQLVVIPGTEWVVSVWWDLDNSKRDSSSYIATVHDLGRLFAEGDRPAQREPIWMARFEQSDAWPQLGSIDAANGGGVRFRFSGREGDSHVHHFRRSLVGELVVEAL